MLLRRCAIVCSLFAIFTVMGAGAMAQSPQAPAAQPTEAAAPKPAAPKVDHAAILKKANEAVGLDIDGRVKRWREELDRIEQGMLNTKADYKALNDFRTALFALRAEAEEFWKKLEPALNSSADNVHALPPAPTQDQEPEQAAAYRAETVAYHAYLDSTRGALDGTHSRVNKALGHLLDIRRSKVASNLLQRFPGSFSPDTWATAPAQIVVLAGKVRSAVAAWWDAQDDDQILPLAGFAFAMWLGLSIIGLVGVRRLRRWEDCGEPPFWRRASDAAGIVLLRSLPVILPLIFLFTALEGAGVLPDDISWLFYSGARSIIVIVVVNALVSTALSPADHRWRLIPASNVAAVRISSLVLTMALIYGTATFLQTAAYLFKAPDSPKLALIFFPNTIIALLIVAILQTPLRSERIGGLPSTSWLRILRLPIWLLALAIVASAASGYLYLSRFITQQLIVTGAILTIVYLMLLWADGIAQAMGSEKSAIGRWLLANGHLDHSGRQRLSVPVSLLLKFGVMLCAIPLILNQWQFSWPDIFEWYRQLFFGFRIGDTQVSLAALFASIVVFALGYFAAKFFQQWLDTQILKPAGLSGGLRDSIRTGVGYVGVAAAALFALSYAGFSLSNLAIVAGAFSVGIGFGLQSVVNNFVSGLILLAERPIKIGDLVVAGGEEGYVRKISVRSTEIETFDGANVLIPNSFFISEKVKNWTLRNNTGRVTIKVNVAHGAVPHQVRAILLQVAQAHPAVMSAPAPVVNFEDIGSDSLEFKLYAFVHDLNTSGSTRTDLRIAILDAFHEAGIAMASQQTDITLRDMDWLRDAVQLYVANALNGHAAGQAGRAPVKHEMEPSG
jgi:potassium-dependent mechanosensitive channel